MVNTKKDAAILLERMTDDNGLYGCKLTEGAVNALLMGAGALNATDWIPVKFDENKNPEFKMPEENEKILVSVNGKVTIDVNVKDYEKNILKYNKDWKNVDAWMKLPEAYTCENK